MKVGSVWMLAVLFACAILPGAQAQGTEAAGRSISLAATATENSVPRLVQFNGILKDAAARPVSGAASVTFAIYADQEGGAAIWSETENVLADANGHYSAVLGAATAGGFPAELFGTGESRWLGVTIARQPEMPRALLASVPYALKAGDAQTLGGLPASSYVTTQQLAARNTVAAPATTTVVAETGAAAPAVAAASNAATLNVPAEDSASQSVTQLSGTGTAQYLPLWTSSSTLGTSKIYQAKGGFVGINTDTPLLQLDVNGNSIFRGSFQMAPQGAATASAGQPSHSFQWQASLYDSSLKAPVNEAFGFRTVPATNNVAGPTAKLDLFYGPGGGTLTDTGLSIDNAGHITFASGQSISVTGEVAASGGVFATTAESFAISGTSSNDYGEGVTGIDTGLYGYGVFAKGDYGGIYAHGDTLAAQLVGDVQITGNLSKAGGSFKIDHPLDPGNKYLYHSFVESPDMKNVYDGVVTTDANGLATVTMPDWFESLNRDFRYQLTTLGQFAQAMVSKEIQNGQFIIQTDKPNVKVSWQITGIRQDAWANAHRIPVEEEKKSAEKGRFLHPELFGHAGELSVGDMRPGPNGTLVPVRGGPEPADK